MYSPNSFDNVSRIIPVAELIAVIEAPGTRAPELSATRPDNLALCAIRLAANKSCAATSNTDLFFIFMV
jgi:hypothetical protein